MALNVKNAPKATGGGKAQPAIDAGSYPARVVQVLDLGLQPQRPYKGEEKDPAHELMMTYEFLDEFCKDEDGEDIEDKPRWLSETFPLRNIEADLATSTKRYKALDPEDQYDGDFTLLVETPCTLVVVNNVGTGKNAGKIYNNIQTVSAMRPRDALKAPELINPPKVFVLDEPDLEVFLSLPEWLQDKIKGNLDFGGSPLEEALAGGKKAEKPKPAKKDRKPVVEEEEEADDEPADDGKW